MIYEKPFRSPDLDPSPWDDTDNRDCCNCVYYGHSSDCDAERTFDGSNGRKITVKEPSGRSHTVLRFDVEMTDTDGGAICDQYEERNYEEDAV